MNINTVIANLLREFADRKIKTYLKGSYGYGTPHQNSDLDIQIDVENVDILENLALHFNAHMKKVFLKNAIGSTYASYSLSFSYQGVDVDVIYEDDYNSLERVKSIIHDISELPAKDKYVLRLVGGALKYDRLDAYKILLLIFARYKQTLDKEVLKKIEEGYLLECKLAKTIRSAVQILYVNEVGSNYKIYFLSDKNSCN
jgi:hypothetical protein